MQSYKGPTLFRSDKQVKKISFQAGRDGDQGQTKLNE
jgi:hypothetical protein